MLFTLSANKSVKLVSLQHGRCMMTWYSAFAGSLCSMKVLHCAHLACPWLQGPTPFYTIFIAMHISLLPMLSWWLLNAVAILRVSSRFLGCSWSFPILVNTHPVWDALIGNPSAFLGQQQHGFPIPHMAATWLVQHIRNAPQQMGQRNSLSAASAAHHPQHKHSRCVQWSMPHTTVHSVCTFLWVASK